MWLLLGGNHDVLQALARLLFPRRVHPVHDRVKGLFLYCLLLALIGIGSASRAQAEVFISEILFNPPNGDTTNEFVELRGTPNLLLPAGTYLVNIEGDEEENPGLVQNVFDLSGRRLGQNGFLVLLQKSHRYRANILATIIANADNDEGWGSGSSSTVGHRGEDAQVELENASGTFFLIQSPVVPVAGTDDIDADDDGTPDGVYASWTVFDSVGVLDSDGDGDCAYGLINFREDKPPGDEATVRQGTIVPVPLTPGYVARNGNTTDWASTNWVASDNLLGRAPLWLLGANSTLVTNTFPSKRARAALNHLGASNFKAPVLPGVLIRQSGTNTLVREGGPSDSYLLSLSMRPTGAVTVRIATELPAQVSIDGGRTYGSEAVCPLLSTGAKKILVRAVNDGAAGPPQRTLQVHHTVTASADQRFSQETLVMPIDVTVVDTNVVLLSEAKINPPGVEDAPFEFLEIRGTPNALLTNLHLLVVQGNASVNPGRSDLVVNLNGHRLGSNGLLLVAAPGQGSSSQGTTVVPLARFATSGGMIDNGSVSILLVGTTHTILEGVDLDAGDNGRLEGLPADAFIVDAIGWEDGGNGDKLYGEVDLSHSFTPDAASRLPANNTPRSVAAWFVGDLLGGNGDSLVFDPDHTSTNALPGSALSPGVVVRNGPRIVPNPLTPVSGVMGDPDNQAVVFGITDADAPWAALTVTANSLNPLVVPDSGLSLSNRGLGKYELSIDPVGVGYADIVVRVADGVFYGYAVLKYAASEPGRPNGHWHTGISDASTAISIDANWMFVGDDENQTLRIFSRTQSGPPVSAKDFTASLRLRDFYDNGLPREVDIEGSTRVGNRIYWLGSHSHAFNATERTNRGRLFATDLSGSGTNAQLKFLAHYDFLKTDLLSWDASDAHGRGAHYYGLVNSAAEGTDPKAPDGSGFNIEGLCMAPGPNNTTNAYIAFRAPLVPPTGIDARSRALLIPVLNYSRLATQPHGPLSAKFGWPIELNLGGRGVRSIEGVGTNYLIVAGPAGAGANPPPPGNFKLFTWSGNPADAPREHSADLSGMNPEGIAEVVPGPWSATNLFQIISDNGTNRYYGLDADGIDQEAKFLPVREFKKFRVDAIALGDVVATPAPAIRFAVAESDGGTTISWFSTEGTTYQVQSKSTFSDEWIDGSEPVIATNSVTRETLSSAPDTQRFFRVIARPSP